MQSKSGLYFLVCVSYMLALFVALYPLSVGFAELRPELVCLLVIYWIISTPQYFGVLFAWGVGLTQDVVEGTVWGAHALALAIVAYICIVAHQRIKNYSVWHQTLWVFVLVGFHQVITNWVQSLAGYEATTKVLVLSAVVSALFWPLLSITLFRLRLKHRLG